MKKYIVILALILISQAGHSQSMDKLFNEFAKKENVTQVTIGTIMMKLSSLFTNTMGVDNIEVLAFDECGQEVKKDLNDALIRIKGKIKPSDIENVIKDHKNGC